jgi:hypothetical protein
MQLRFTLHGGPKTRFTPRFAERRPGILKVRADCTAVSVSAEQRSSKAIRKIKVKLERKSQDGAAETEMVDIECGVLNVTDKSVQHVKETRLRWNNKRLKRYFKRSDAEVNWLKLSVFQPEQSAAQEDLIAPFSAIRFGDQVEPFTPLQSATLPPAVRKVTGRNEPLTTAAAAVIRMGTIPVREFKVPGVGRVAWSVNVANDQPLPL